MPMLRRSRMPATGITFTQRSWSPPIVTPALVDDIVGAKFLAPHNSAFGDGFSIMRIGTSISNPTLAVAQQTTKRNFAILTSFGSSDPQATQMLLKENLSSSNRS